MRNKFVLPLLSFRIIRATESAAEQPVLVDGKDGVLRCRDEGVALMASAKAWVLDEPTEFQWMPGGTTTICAHYDDRAIQVAVECGPHTADVVQSKFQAIQAQHKHQKPFGCVEHREQEAAFYPIKFAWKDDPEPGIFCTATPSALGAQNVNGRIHRSFSPCFHTDADYAKAVCSGCRKESAACKCSAPGMLTFPKGVRGSATNPAAITGVPFDVGSLTNKPAFKNILPVRAKDAGEIIQATWSDNARKAAAEARKKHSGGGEEYAFKLSHIAHKSTAKARTKSEHKFAANMHSKAADAHDEAGTDEGESHREMAETHHQASEETHGKEKTKVENFMATDSQPSVLQRLKASCAKPVDTAAVLARLGGKPIKASGTSDGVKKSWESRKGQFMRGEGADNLRRAHSDAGGYAKREHAQVEIGRATLKSESHWMGSKKDQSEKIKHVEETHGKSDSEAEKHLISKGWAVYHRSHPTEINDDSPYNKSSDTEPTIHQRLKASC